MGYFWQFADEVGFAKAIGDSFHHPIVFPNFIIYLGELTL
jgi:hypothetical protein